MFALLHALRRTCLRPDRRKFPRWRPGMPVILLGSRIPHLVDPEEVPREPNPSSAQLSSVTRSAVNPMPEVRPDDPSLLPKQPGNSVVQLPLWALVDDPVVRGALAPPGRHHGRDPRTGGRLHRADEEPLTTQLKNALIRLSHESSL